jgi:hypothetical protein
LAATRRPAAKPPALRNDVLSLLHKDPGAAETAAA